MALSLEWVQGCRIWNWSEHLSTSLSSWETTVYTGGILRDIRFGKYSSLVLVYVFWIGLVYNYEHSLWIDDGNQGLVFEQIGCC